jgi:flagellin
MASRNSLEASSVLQVAEGGTEQIHNMLTRLKELATQAASSNSDGNRTEIDAEAQQLISEIDRISQSTEYNGNSLLDGYGTKTTPGCLTTVDNLYSLDAAGMATGTYEFSYNSTTNIVTLTNDVTNEVETASLSTNTTINFGVLGLSFKTTAGASVDGMGAALAALGSLAVTGTGATFQIGDTNASDKQLSFSISSLRTSALSIDSLALSSQSGAQSALDTIDTAIDTVNTVRGNIGANMNRLSYASSNLQTAVENLTASESVIRDVDMAAEMSNFTKSQILQQAGVSMLAQANTLPQSVLSIIG